MQYNQIALVLDPGNPVYREDLANTMAFLADSWMDKCDLGKAFEFRRQGVELSRQLLQEAPADTGRKRLLATALSGWAAVQWRMSLLEPAIEGFRESEKYWPAAGIDVSVAARTRWVEDAGHVPGAEEKETGGEVRLRLVR